MKRRVVWSDEARADYLEALRYISRRNPDAALRVAERIENAGSALADFPTGRAGRVNGTYEKVVTSLPYIITYEIVSMPEGGEMVAILHVIHGARDWPEDQWPKSKIGRS
jgi:toxin ParE1/3/4